jgi:hypothetical protein
MYATDLPKRDSTLPEAVSEQDQRSLSGEPPPRPLRTVFHPDPIRMLRPLWALQMLFHPDWLRILWMVFQAHVPTQEAALPNRATPFSHAITALTAVTV